LLVTGFRFSKKPNVALSRPPQKSAQMEMSIRLIRQVKSAHTNLGYKENACLMHINFHNEGKHFQANQYS
jgi:hypothetical protein